MGARLYTYITSVEFGPGEIAVEIGADNGEQSTQFLKDYCACRGIPFYSVDIEPSPTAQELGVIQADGLEFLQTISRDIKFAYLDNYDYVWPEIEGAEFVKVQREQYAKRGVVMTNVGSEQVHLDQSMCIHTRSGPGAVIVIDDTWFDGLCYYGKGARAVPWLLHRGWCPEARVISGPPGAISLRRIWQKGGVVV